MPEINGNQDAVAAYLMRQGKEVNDSNIQECRDELYALADNIWDCSDTSLFTLDENMQMTEEEFIKHLRRGATGGEINEEQAKLFFEVLNFDGGDTLSYSELSLIEDSDQNGVVTNWGIWQSIIGNVESKDVMSSSSSMKHISSDESKSYAERLKDIYGEDSEEYEAALNGEEQVISKKSLKQDKIDELAQKIFDGEVELEDYEGLLTETSYQALSEAYDKLKNENNADGAANPDRAVGAQDSVQAGSQESTKTSNLGATEAQNTSTDEEGLAAVEQEQNSEQETNYVKVDTKICADDLYKAMKGLGTDEATLKDILLDQNISPDQFAEIVEIYEQTYGMNATPPGVSLVTRIEQDTSGDLQKQLTSSLGTKLMEAAKNGDDTAIDMICLNLYSGTVGQNGTADDFLAAVFNGLVAEGSDSEPDYELINKINNRYSELTPKDNGANRSLVKDLQSDHGGFLNWRNWFGHWGDSNLSASADGQKYIDLINEANRRDIDEE